MAAGLGDVFLEARDGFVAGEAGRGEGVGGDAAAAEDLFAEGGAVYHEREGAADARVVERGAGGVVGKEEGGEGGVLAEEGGLVAFVDLDLVGREAGGDVELAGAEGGFLGGAVLDGVDVDGVEVDVGAVPVGFAAGEADDLVGLPGGEVERAVADVVAGAGPVGAAFIHAAEFFDGGAVHGVPRLVHDEGGQVGDGRVEREGEGAVVDHADADLGEVGEFAGVEGFGVAQTVEERGVFGGEAGGEDALEGVGEVAGGDGVAVGPAGVGAEVERPREVVGGDLPAFGDTGDGVGVGGVHRGETLHEAEDDLGVGDAGDELRVEIGRFGGVAEVESLGAVAEGDAGFGALAGGGGEEKREGGGDGEKEAAKHEGGTREGGISSEKSHAVEGVADGGEAGAARGLFLRGGGELFVEAFLDVGHFGEEFLLLLFAFAAVDDAELGGVADDVGGEGEQASEDALVFERTEVEGGEFVGEGEGFAGDGLGLGEVVVEDLVFGEFGGEHDADLVGDLLAVAGEGFAGEVLILGDVGEDGLDAGGEAFGDLVDLLVLDALGFLGGFGERVERLDFLGDGLGELVDLGLVGLGEFFFAHEGVGGAFFDGVFEEGVDGVDLAAGLFGGGLEFGGVLLADGGEFLLLGGLEGDDAGVGVINGTADDQHENEEEGELFLKFGPHGGVG